jgi:NinB protein
MRFCRSITARNRADVIRDVANAPLGWRITIEQPRRTTAQNSLMWVLLEAFADQVEHFGHRYDATTWKCIAMKALGKELQFAPSLDGHEIVALGYHSSDLSKAEMADMIEFLYAEGAKRGVVFHGGKAA